jgi:hypothetical protein
MFNFTYLKGSRFEVTKEHLDYTVTLGHLDLDESGYRHIFYSDSYVTLTKDDIAELVLFCRLLDDARRANKDVYQVQM